MSRLAVILVTANFTLSAVDIAYGNYRPMSFACDAIIILTLWWFYGRRTQ